MDRVGSIGLDLLSEDDSLLRSMGENPFDEFFPFDLRPIKTEVEDATELEWDAVKEDKENCSHHELPPFVNVRYSENFNGPVQNHALHTKAKQRRVDPQLLQPKKEIGVELHDAILFDCHDDGLVAKEHRQRTHRVTLPPSPPLANVRFGTVDVQMHPEKVVFVYSKKHRIPSIRVGYDGIHFDEQKVSRMNAAFGLKRSPQRLENSPAWSSSNTSRSSDSF